MQNPLKNLKLDPAPPAQIKGVKTEQAIAGQFNGQAPGGANLSALIKGNNFVQGKPMAVYKQEPPPNAMMKVAPNEPQ